MLTGRFQNVRLKAGSELEQQNKWCNHLPVGIRVSVVEGALLVVVPVRQQEGELTAGDNLVLSPVHSLYESKATRITLSVSDLQCG